MKKIPLCIQLKNFRLTRKLSQRALASKLGCSHSYICKMEHGKTDIKPCILTGYKLIGFKENQHDNPTTFTSEEYRELKAYHDKQQESINSLNKKVHHIYSVAYNNSRQIDGINNALLDMCDKYDNDNQFSYEPQLQKEASKFKSVLCNTDYWFIASMIMFIILIIMVLFSKFGG